METIWFKWHEAIMTTKQTWKNLEKKTAHSLNGQRSGNRGIESPDVLHDCFSVECKYRANLAFKKWYDQAKKYAKGTDKIPLLICKEKGQCGEFVIISMKHFKELIMINKADR
jgi:hypothetical protein